jgi:hypothetical protein
MIKRVTNMDMVPDDLQELLLPDKGEYVPIGHHMYELFPFPITQYLKLLEFIGSYFEIYNGIYKNSTGLSQMQFFGILADKLIEHNLVGKLIEMFPDIEEDIDSITKEQLIYLLSIIYKLNFLVKKNPKMDIQTKIANQKLLEMLGLKVLVQN